MSAEPTEGWLAVQESTGYSHRELVPVRPSIPAISVAEHERRMAEAEAKAFQAGRREERDEFLNHAELVAEAVAQERARCAEIVHGAYRDNRSAEERGFTRHWSGTCDAIAARIESGETP